MPATIANIPVTIGYVFIAPSASALKNSTASTPVRSSTLIGESSFSATMDDMVSFKEVNPLASGSWESGVPTRSSRSKFDEPALKFATASSPSSVMYPVTKVPG